MKFPSFQIPKRYERSEIPNQAGFLLTVFMKDGSEQKTVVSTRQDGTHFLTGIEFKNVVNWTPRKI